MDCRLASWTDRFDGESNRRLGVWFAVYLLNAGTLVENLTAGLVFGFFKDTLNNPGFTRGEKRHSGTNALRICFRERKTKTVFCFFYYTINYLPSIAKSIAT